MVKAKPTAWGLNLDITSLIVIAALTALYYIVGAFITIPIGPTTFITFGEIFMWLGAALYGPIWGAVIGGIGITYTALVIFGQPLTIVGVALEGFLAGLFMKKMPLTASAVIAQVLASVFWYWDLAIVSGFGHELTMVIIAKGIVNQALNAVIASFVFQIPNIQKYLPITFDSKPVRDLLAKK